jgi:hypothetical protein
MDVEGRCIVSRSTPAPHVREVIHGMRVPKSVRLYPADLEAISV